jgi:hypothetical protein
VITVVVHAHHIVYSILSGKKTINYMLANLFVARILIH